MVFETLQNKENNALNVSFDKTKLSHANEKTVNKYLWWVWDWIVTNSNPTNRWVEDYTAKGDFNTAYSAARKAGEQKFMWNGCRYSTNMKGTPGDQLKWSGITNSQTQNRDIVQDRLAKNLAPIGYDKPIKRFIEAVIENKTDSYRNTVSERRMDAYRLYMGIPQINNTFTISKYTPAKSKDKNILYYSIQDDNLKSNLLNIINKEGDPIKYRELLQKNELSLDNTYSDIMGKFLFDIGSDDNGKYISYYDKRDINVINFKNPITWKEITTDFGKPFEIYDRIYYRENPLYYLPRYKNIENEISRLKSIVSSSEYDQNWNPIYKDKNWNIVKLPKEYIYSMDYEKYLYKIIADRPPKYIRQYFSDKELLKLDVNKKNFDALALQRELSNRGYKFLKSTKKDGDFDWILGDETKEALLDWQKKNWGKK